MPIPLKGDRSAFDDIDYPLLHAADLEAGTPIHHLPIDPAEGDIPIWRTDHWELETAGATGSVELSEGAVGYGDTDDTLTGDAAILKFDPLNCVLQVGAIEALDSLVPSIYVSGDGAAARLATVSYGDTPIISAWKTGGTKASKTSVGSGDNLLWISAVGYAASSWRAAGTFIKAIATEAWTATERGSKWLFQVTETGTVDIIDALELTGTEATFGVQVILDGDARVIKDVEIPLSGLGKGAAAPANVYLGNYLGFEFTTNDTVYYSTELPYDWDESTDIILEIHWYINEVVGDPVKEVAWEIYYTATKENATETVDHDTHTVASGDIVIPTLAKQLTDTEFSIPHSELEHDDVIGIIIKRVAIADGTAPTAKPVIVGAMLEYTVHTLGEAI